MAYGKNTNIVTMWSVEVDFSELLDPFDLKQDFTNIYGIFWVLWIPLICIAILSRLFMGSNLVNFEN